MTLVRGIGRALGSTLTTREGLTWGLTATVLEPWFFSTFHSLSLSDGLTLNDDLARDATLALTDGMALGDAAASSVGKVLVDSVNLSENQTSQLAIVQRALVCTLRGLTDIICRDPETAQGGLTPGNTDLHAPGFYRTDREELEFLSGQSIDRRVQVIPTGMDNWTSMNIAGGRLHTVQGKIRIGYFLGDHAIDSFGVIADDDSQIMQVLSKQSNWPACRGLVNLRPLGSNVVRVDTTRQINEILVELQVS